MPRKEALTPGDRLVTALIASFCGFLVMLLIWFAVMSVGGRAGRDTALPFHWTLIGAALFAAVGFAVGPDRAMDGIENVWWLIGQLLGFDSERPADRRKGRF